MPVMKEKRAEISYTFEELPAGGPSKFVPVIVTDVPTGPIVVARLFVKWCERYYSNGIYKLRIRQPA